VPAAGHASYIDAPEAVAGWIEQAVQQYRTEGQQEPSAASLNP
jgi:hypothetical protein